MPRARNGTLAVGSWALYDLANTAFSMGVVSNFFPLWVRDEVGAGRADYTYTFMMAISMGIIFVAAPILGAMTDRRPRRMPFLIFTTLICIVLTGLLGRWGLLISGLLFIIANIAYEAGLQFYDALLPDVSTPETVGKIGGIGVGVGYLGAYLVLVLALVFGTEDKVFLFELVAVAFLFFSVPCFFLVKEKGNPNPQSITFRSIWESLARTIRTLKDTERFPHLLRFLIGRMFYVDAINTVITVMVLVIVNVAIASGLTEEQGEKRGQIILLGATTFAILGGFFWGWLSDRIGPKRTLNIVLRCWLVILIGAAGIAFFRLPLPFFYGIAAWAGFSLGGVWASDRPLMLRLTPPDRVGEFFGIYGMVSRFAAVVGPVFWGIITFWTIRKIGLHPLTGQAIAMLSLMGMVLVGYVILRPVSDVSRTD